MFISHFLCPFSSTLSLSTLSLSFLLLLYCLASNTPLNPVLFFNFFILYLTLHTSLNNVPSRLWLTYDVCFLLPSRNRVSATGDKSKVKINEEKARPLTFDMLSSDTTIVLDTDFGVFVWVGANVPEQDRKSSINKTLVSTSHSKIVHFRFSACSKLASLLG